MVETDLTAAGQLYSQSYADRRVRTDGDSWQSTAWSFYDSTPEVRFAANWVGNTMERATLFAARLGLDGKVERLPDDHPASQIVAAIGGSTTGQSQLLGDIGIHLTVAGELWVVIMPGNTNDKWYVVSTEEIKEQGGSLKAEIDGVETTIPRFDDTQPPDPNSTDPVAVRVWNPHPRRHVNADSPIRSSFALLDELLLLNAAVAAIAKSRLTGRGIVWFPAGSKIPTRSGPEGEAEDDFMTTLMQIAGTAYGDPNSAAATVPLLAEIPGEAAQAPFWMDFASSFDELAIKLREECVRRFATGLDTPAEVLLGTGDVNHWGQWAIDDAALRLASEPKLRVVCSAFTTALLTPALEAQRDPEAEEIFVWYDPIGMRSRTNQSQTALAANAGDLISDEAARRELGYTEDDKPTDEQLKQHLILQVLPMVPEYQDQLLNQLLSPLGINVQHVEPPGGAHQEGERMPGPGTQPPRAPGPPKPVAPVPVLPNAGPPRTQPAAAETDIIEAFTAAVGSQFEAEQLAAIDGLVYRALEKAGQRLRTKQPRSLAPELREIEASLMHVRCTPDVADLDALLACAWDRVPEIAERYNLDADCLVRELDEYTRGVLAAGVPHSWNRLPDSLRDPCHAVEPPLVDDLESASV